MSAIVRKTYDTDSIVLRRIFAVNPDTNSQVSTNYLLATGSNGRAVFQDGSAYLSTIGFPTSALLQSTVTGLGTIGYLSSGGGGGEVTKANLTSTTQGLGTLNYISSAQLTSSIVGLSNVAVTRIVAGTNVSISPTNGQGIVTINASGGGGTGSPVYDSEIASTLQKSGYFSSIKLGYFAASSQQQLNAIAIGTNAANENQQESAIAIGLRAGFSTQNVEAIAIGLFAGNSAQGQYTVGIGSLAGSENQSDKAIAIGESAGSLNQATQAIAIGQESGKYRQGVSAVAIGTVSALQDQGRYSVAIGTGAGYILQSSFAVAIGYEAGNLYQSFSSIAIGTRAGNVSQGKQAIAIGNSAGNELQGDYSIAIGDRAGYLSLPHSTIVVSALGSNLSPSQPRAFHVAPIRDIDGTQTNSLGYDTTTYEIGLINSLTRLDLASTVRGLATTGYVSTSQLTSTVAGISRNLSTVYNISSAGGINISGPTTGIYINNTNANISTLINNNITINTTGGNVNDVDLTSSIRGLATFGYISSTQITSTLAGLGNAGYISSTQLASTLASTISGLGNVAVTQIIAGTNVSISPTNGLGIVTINATGGSGGGGSGDVTSTNLTSTTLGLGTLGYISSTQLASTLASTVRGLGTVGYVSSSALPSTVLGLSRFYVSTTGLGSNLSSFSTSIATSFYTRVLTASTVTADLLNVSTISFGTGSGFITFPFIRATYISSFSTQTDYQIINRYISGSQLQFSSLQSQTLLTANAAMSSLSTIFISSGSGNISALNVPSTITLNNAQLRASTYISSVELTNLQVNNLNVNSFGPVRVVVSTLSNVHAYLQAYDIGKYFLFTQNNSNCSVSLPTYNNSFEGWNCVIRNMPASSEIIALSTTVNPSAGANIAPGTTVTVVGSGNSYYIL